MRASCGSTLLLLVPFAVGCAGAPPPVVHARVAPLQRAAPLAPDQHVTREPLDPSMLGQRLTERYDAKRPLHDQLSENPCKMHLVEGDAPDTVVQARGYRAGVYYDLTLRGGVERRATEAYATCCREQDCGVGYLRALEHGAGTLTVVSPTSAGGNSDVALADDTAGTYEELTFSSAPRKVRGWVTLRISSAAQADPSRAPHPAAIEIRANDNGLGFAYWSAQGPISENEFVRRYETVTGSLVLHDYLRPRNHRKLAWFSGAAAVVTAATAATLLAVAEPGIDRDVPAAGVIGVSALLVLQTVLMAVEPYDGYDSRLLGLEEARLFASRYNRALEAQDR